MKMDYFLAAESAFFAVSTFTVVSTLTVESIFTVESTFTAVVSGVEEDSDCCYKQQRNQQLPEPLITFSFLRILIVIQ